MGTNWDDASSDPIGDIRSMIHAYEQQQVCPFTNTPIEGLDLERIKGYPWPETYGCPNCSAHVMVMDGRFSVHFWTPPLDEPSNLVGD